MRIRPIAARVTIRLLLPYETSGSGMPVSGAMPITAYRLRLAWIRIRPVRPEARIRP